MNNIITSEEYAAGTATQLRKGFLSYCVLIVCSDTPLYTSDILSRLRQTELVVVEGTIYPLLSRLQRDGLLQHQWQESEQGPPRKYYHITQYGQEVKQHLAHTITQLNQSLKTL